MGMSGTCSSQALQAFGASSCCQGPAPPCSLRTPLIQFEFCSGTTCSHRHDGHTSAGCACLSLNGTYPDFLLRQFWQNSQDTIDAYICYIPEDSMTFQCHSDTCLNQIVCNRTSQIVIQTFQFQPDPWPAGTCPVQAWSNRRCHGKWSGRASQRQKICEGCFPGPIWYDCKIRQCVDWTTFSSRTDNH